MKNSKLKRAKPLSKKEYAGLYRDVAPYVSFKYSVREIEKYGLSSWDKKQLKHYHAHISALKNRPHVVFKTLKKSELKTAQKFSRQEKLKYIKVAFVPTKGGKRAPKITFKDGKMTVKMGKVTEHFIELSTPRLIEDPKKHIEERIAKYDETKTKFKINAGEYVIKGAFIKNNVAQKVAQLMNRYGATYGNDAGPLAGKENKYHKAADWLNGLTAFTFNNQASFKQFNHAWIVAKEAKLEESRKARNRQKYQDRKKRGY